MRRRGSLNRLGVLPNRKGSKWRSKTVRPNRGPGSIAISRPVRAPIVATAYAIADAYQGQRRLGDISIAASHCHILTDPAHPNVCDANHADDVTAQASCCREL